MALKLNIFLITIEFLLLGYIFLDLYASTLHGANDVVASPEDIPVHLNATNEDPKIVGMGNFAVDEYNRLSSSHLKLVSVVRAVVVRASYILLIRVKDGAIPQSKLYGAIVGLQRNGIRLIAFEEEHSNFAF